MRLFVTLCSLSLTVFTATAAPAPTAQIAQAARAPLALAAVQSVEGITEYRLPNGLQVLLVPDDAKPTTTVNLTYRVGSRHENYGETGMAHLLEHLVFKGTPKNPHVWREFSRRGLQANGSTWVDRTNYFASFTANDANLRWFLAWHADAMVNSFIAKKDLDTEMTVVRNEMEMGENSPQGVLYEKTLATMYQWHNYGKSTIGARADVENVDIERLRAFYRTYYQPDNATLIVAGKFDEAKVLAWIKADFGRIPAPKRALPRLYTLDAAQDGERSVVVRRQGGVPLVFAGYHAPPGAHPDFAAIEVLGRTLAEAPAGRLHKALVETNQAASVFAYAADLVDPGFMIFGAQLAPGQSPDVARQSVLATLEGLGQQPMHDEEVARAKARWLKDWEQRFADPETVGVALSEAVANADWRLFFLQRDRVKAVTAADVMRVAKAYLLPTNRTLGQYLPTDAPQLAPAPQAVNVAAQLRLFKGAAQAAKAEAFEASPSRIDARTRRFEVAPGLKVALLPKGTRGDVVTAQLTLALGDAASLVGQQAVGEVLVQMLDKGTRALSRQQLQDQLTALKAEVQWGGSATEWTAQITTTREHLPGVIALLGQMARQPGLPEQGLDEVKRQTLSAIEAQRKEPDALAQQQLAQHSNAYPRGDVRHARTFDQMAADTQAVTLAQLQAFHGRFAGAARAQFAAVGAMDEAAVQSALRQAFDGWLAPAAPQRVPRPLVAVPAARFVLETPDKQNATLMAQLAMPVRELDADHAALLVANFAFGSGGNSRLWSRIREAEGLSYDVRSSIRWAAHEANSLWQASAIFAPQNRAKVEAAIAQELARADQDGFNAKEIAAAREALLSFRKLSRAQDPVLAATLARNEQLGRTLAQSQALDDRIQAVTAAQASAAWRKYIRPSALVTAVAGDFKGR